LRPYGLGVSRVRKLGYLLNEITSSVGRTEINETFGRKGADPEKRLSVKEKPM
jgi:biotin operon repressor